MNIWKILISLVKAKLAGRGHVQSILHNSSWLLGDRLFRMAVGVFINIWIARYLGPEQFGLWSYCISFAGLFVVFSNLGLDSIVVREMVRSPENEAAILGTAFWLKLIAGFVTFLITLFAIFFVRKGDALTLWLVGLYSGGYIFQSLNVIDLYFQSKVKSKYTVISSGAAFTLASITKIILLLMHAPLVAFAAIGFCEMVFTALFLVLAYRVNQRQITQWTFRNQLAKELLGYSWPMILSGVSMMISLRVDQIMIGNILGDREVGIFAAAARMSELSFIVPMAIISSATFSIIRAKKQGKEVYLRRMQKLMDLTSVLSFGVAILITFSSRLIISLLYGVDYAESAPLLAMHAWSGLFSCLGAASGIWMTSEGLQINIFYRTFLGMMVNIVLNYWWIPIYGVMGAAIATICSQMMMSYISDFFLPATRQIFYMKTRSLLMKNIVGKVLG